VRLAISGTFTRKTPPGRKKSHVDPKLLTAGGAKTVAVALPHHSLLGMTIYWRKADILPLNSASLKLPKEGEKLRWNFSASL